jgi:hypothetical protein
MPVLVLELRLAFAIVDPASVRVSYEEDSVVHVIRNARKMDVIEAAGRLIAEDEVEIPSNDILWGCGPNFSFQRHPLERIGFEDHQRCRPPNGASWPTRFLQNQLAIGDSPGTGTI